MATLSVLGIGIANVPLAYSQSINNASSVSIHGVIDIGMTYLNNAGASSGGLSRIHSGGMNTSRIGFKGSEDLGGGMQSFFQLETGFSPDTGAMSGNQHLFDRQANPGLAGQYGKILLGRSASTTGDFYVYDPIGNNYSWSEAGTTSRGGHKDGALGRISNVIKYEGKFNAYRIGASYGLGEAAGNTNTNAKYAVGVEYAGSDFGLAMTYDRENIDTGSPGYHRAGNIHLSGAYTFTWAKVYAGYRQHVKKTMTGGTEMRSDFIWLGASRKLSESMVLSGAIYHIDMRSDPKGNKSNPTMYVARLQYGLSPRTSVYLTGAYAGAEDQQPVGVSNNPRFHAENGAQVGINMGVQHRF